MLAGDFFAHLRPTYDLIRATGTPLCSLTSLIGSVQIRQLANFGATVAHECALELLRRTQKRNPREVHFHVDRAGNPAFIKFSDAFLS